MDSLRRSIQASEQFTPNDRLFAIILMIAGSSLLTSLTFSSSENDRTSTLIITSWGCFLLIGGMLILCGTHLRLDLPVWTLLLSGCIVSGGALSLATFLVGSNWRALAYGTWGWVIGMAFFSQLKSRQRQKMSGALDVELQESQQQSR